MKKRIVAFLLMTIMLMSSMSQVMAISFSDVPADHWANEYITTLADAKVINGYEDGTFQPNGTITRGEFVKLVVSSSFTPALLKNISSWKVDHWAMPYVQLAEKTKILKPYDITLENINEPITRIEMVRIISSADLYRREANAMVAKVSFTDVGELTIEDNLYLCHSVNKGYLTGYEDNTFRLEANMTRAEAATVIYRYRTIK